MGFLRVNVILQRHFANLFLNNNKKIFITEHNVDICNVSNNIVFGMCRLER